MENILPDKEKFEELVYDEKQDKMAKLERKLIKCLLELVNSKVLTNEVYDRIRPTGSQRPPMQGIHFIPFVGGGGGGWLHIFHAEKILSWQKLGMSGTGPQFP